MPAADPERHPEALAIGRRCRSRRTFCRRLFARHHPRQHPAPGNSAKTHRGPDRGHPGHRPVLARLGRRQHPQRHGHADRGDRSGGTDRHPAIRARMALPHPQRPLADGTAAQVQRRLRRRRQDRGAGRHQRHRVRRRRSEGRFRRRARRLVSARDRRHHRAQGFRQGNRHHRPAGRRDHGRRRHRAGVHRDRRSHQSPEGADEIRDRRAWVWKNSCSRSKPSTASR